MNASDKKDTPRTKRKTEEQKKTRKEKNFSPKQDSHQPHEIPLRELSGKSATDILRILKDS